MYLNPASQGRRPAVGGLAEEAAAEEGTAGGTAVAGLGGRGIGR